MISPDISQPLKPCCRNEGKSTPSPLLLPAVPVSHRKDNLGDGIDYSQQRRENLGELIMETLEAFEVNGGEDAFINIKYLVPVFQSVVVS